MKACLSLLALLAIITAGEAHADRQSPVDQGVITSVRGYRKDPFGSGKLMFHRGTDIAVPAGTRVYPTQRGRVHFSGKYRGYGNLVAIDHGNSFVTIYGHNQRLLVKVGDWVDTDTVIALAGSTGHSTGPHVHYEVRQWPGGRSPNFNEAVQPTHGQGQVEKQQVVHEAPASEYAWVDQYIEGGM
jgi:murein DD-endopeptidase MepM/ murein hydrolase activator NlpD